MFVKTKIDPASKVRAYIDDALEHTTYISSDLAHRLVDKLRDEAPDVLQEWLNSVAVDVMRDTINRVQQSRRSVVRQRAKTSVFKAAVDAAEAGETGLLEGWLTQPYLTNPENIRKPLGEMYRAEILHAVAVYERLARGNQMQVAFLNAIANRVGARRVNEVWDNDQLDTLWRSLEVDGTI